MSTSNLANASNEKREQNIMQLRNDFDHLRVITVNQAVNKYGYQANTILKWARTKTNGHIPIPLIVDNQTTAVELTHQNQPHCLPPIDNAGDMLIAFMQTKKG